jgi:hypothetical protein
MTLKPVDYTVDLGDRLVRAFPDCLQLRRLSPGPCRVLLPDTVSFLETSRVGYAVVAGLHPVACDPLKCSRTVHQAPAPETSAFYSSVTLFTPTLIVAPRMQPVISLSDRFQDSVDAQISRRSTLSPPSISFALLQGRTTCTVLERPSSDCYATTRSLLPPANRRDMLYKRINLRVQSGVPCLCNLGAEGNVPI